MEQAEAISEEGWSDLLEYLLRARGFDFHGYKPASLMRRVRKRMDVVGVDTFPAYQDYLEVHVDEFGELFNTILINVTSFFRDPEAWESLATKVLPDLLRDRGSTDPIRVWSAGCATGEEAFTLAMVLAETLGIDQFRERVKIYATDVDNEALTIARQATYTPRQLQGVPPALLARYFEEADGSFTFRKELRRFVIFGRHDLLQDAPISRIDLLVCRNALMYFNAEAQGRILARFHFALNDGGVLFLGRAETLMAHAATFTAVDLKRRISRKVKVHMRDRSSFPPPSRDPLDGDRSPMAIRLREAALDASRLAQLVIDAEGHLVIANERARALFGLGPSDLGRPVQDLQLSYRPVELRSLIEQSGIDHRPVNVKDVEWRTAGGEAHWLDVQVCVLSDASGGTIGTSVTFSDVTAVKRLQRELEQTNQELETAYEELQSTNEELETTNEELQSTVEELETTNEELQSTNEELETMNEELQSTNEELQTINDESRHRGEELNAANSFLESVLSSLHTGVAVVDRDLRLLSWNRQAEELWGLRPEEAVGQHMLNLEIGLPVSHLRPALRSCVAGDGSGTPTVVDAVNRRGKPIRCRVTCTPLVGGGGEVRGVIMLMEEVGVTADTAAPGPVA
jgi:two-component system CheB/CheR fusion protein